MGTQLYGAVEAGGTKFICEVVDQNHTVLANTRIATTTPGETLAAVQQFFAAYESGTDTYAAIGIAAFGPLDLQQNSSTFGHILGTPKPHWSGTDLVSGLKQRFNCPVQVDTDVNAAALAEAELGAGKNCDVVVYVTVGTGIGGGVCIRGQTLHGALHPEMGHIRVERHSADSTFPGTCPFHGDCLEGLASGTAITARYGRSLNALLSSEVACSVTGYYLGQLASNIVLLLSPQRLIFGGGVMQHQALYEEIRTRVSKLLDGYAGLGKTVMPLDKLIVAPALGERSGISGAFLLAQGAATALSCQR